MSTVAPDVLPKEVDSHLNSPPDSSKESPSLKHDASASDSELSDIEDPEEDIGVIEPESWADDGRVPVFKPTMEQFKSFPRYMKGVNPYGMKSGIVKVIPPAEWKHGLPRLDEAIKTIKVKEPIKQDIMGTSGTYRQANILHQRSYNLPQWRQLCEQSEHQPPAKRGERRLNQDKPPVPRATPKTKGTSTPTTSTTGKRKPGRPFKNKVKAAVTLSVDGSATPDRLPTPVSPSLKPEDDMESVKAEPEEYEETPVRGRMGGRQPQSISVSSRRKYNRKEAAAKVDEAAFKDFQYELDEEFSAERCEELERAYWKTLTYAPPLYGADMPGSLFTDATSTWNLGKLENILDVLGTKIPGVNTAYLYLGMWKATFAWHLEDVDLYSINYLHFGAPKQWYSISQGDARRFEAAMKTIWPTDAKACDQFLRHKTFLISPSHLLQNFNIKVNKIVCYPGEFVITFPYGYHSGYNLGYNCAEAVNFGMESWLEYGRVAKKCDCSQAQDSVWIDVREIERKMRGEETEFEETEDEEDDDDEDENGGVDLPTPRSNGEIKTQAPKKKRKRPTTEKGQPVSLKRVRLRLKAPAREPCMLCPNDIPNEPLLLTEDGEKVHRMCALYIPETSIESGDSEIVRDVKYIAKARLDLKCNYCRSKKGACFQCSQKKCIRAYHATCAAAAGVFVEQGETPVFGVDGTEYKEHGIEFSCRFHRIKRDKNLQANDLSEVERIRKAGLELKIGETCQMQYFRADIFAGTVVENRTSEETLLVNILPRGERIEVEYKWLLIPSPADFKLVKPSANAIPLPKSFMAKESLNTSKRKVDDIPRAGDPFVKGCTWTEFKNDAIARNPYQVKIDFAKENQIWYYLGKTSTEARAQFTEDVTKQRHNPKGHFLDTIPKTINTAPRQSYAASYPSNVNQNALNASKGSIRPPQPTALRKDDKPYIYKPRIPNSNDTYRVDPQAYRSQQNFLHASTPNPTPSTQAPTLAFGTDPRWRPASTSSTQPYTPTPPPILPGATVATYSKYSGYPASGPVSQQPRPQYQQTNKQVGQQVNQQLNQQANQRTNAQSAQQQQQSQIIPPQKQYHPQQQQPQPRSQPPQSRAVLAPPAPYRPSYTPPNLHPPRQNPFSASRPSTSKTNPFAKYPYLQKEHNRAVSDYKSPYRPGGGFMNGYEGNLKRHLEREMFRNRQGSWNEVASSAPSYVSNGQRMYSASQPSPTGYTHASQSPSYESHAVASSPQQSAFQPHQITKATVEQGWGKKDPSQHHPAIREEYTNADYHNLYQPRPTPSQYPVSSPQTTQGQHMPQTQQYQYQHSQQQYQTHQNSPVLQPPQQVYRSHQNSPPLHSPQHYQPYQPHQRPSNSPNTGTPTTVLAPPGQAPLQYHQHQIPQQAGYREAKPMYAHQQPFQNPSSQGHAQPLTQYRPQPPTPVQTQYSPAPSMYSQPNSMSQSQTAPSHSSYARDFPDVPADSTSIIEQMLANLKKARPTSSSSMM